MTQNNNLPQKQKKIQIDHMTDGYVEESSKPLQECIKTKKKKKEVDKGGRPWFDGKDEQNIITKLEYCWSLGVSDKIASEFAEISTASLSRYIKSHPVVSERKTKLLNEPYLKANDAIVKSFEKNPEIALKYLKSKFSKEFVSGMREPEEGGMNFNTLVINVIKGIEDRKSIDVEVVEDDA